MVLFLCTLVNTTTAILYILGSCSSNGKYRKQKQGSVLLFMPGRRSCGKQPPPHGVGYQEGILCTLLNSIHMDIPVADVACLKRMCWKLFLFRPKPQPLIEFCMAKIRLFRFSGNCCECIWLKQSELRHHRKSDELFFVFLYHV